MANENQTVSRYRESAQQKVEGYNFDIRKHLVEYDDVINKQREIIYARRRRLLDLGDDSVDTGDKSLETELLEKAQQYADSYDEFEQDFKAKKSLLGEAKFQELLKYIFLTTIDHLWMEHIDLLDELRAGIGLRGYGQRDPLVEFKNEAYRLFEKLVSDIDYEIVIRFKRVKIETPEAINIHQEDVLQRVQAQHRQLRQYAVNKQQRLAQQDSATSTGPRPQPVKQQTVRKSVGQDIGRNDPCPCGSGKKYKHCGLKNTPEHQANMTKKH